jgi:hypothetical protein
LQKLKRPVFSGLRLSCQHLLCSWKSNRTSRSVLRKRVGSDFVRTVDVVLWEQK